MVFKVTPAAVRRVLDEKTKRERWEMQNDHRKTWFILSWNGKGWNWSYPMVRELARMQYETVKSRMPNCPHKLVCVEEIEQHVGDHKSDADRRRLDGIGMVRGEY